MPSYRALAALAATAVLVGGGAFAQTPHSVFAPAPFVDRGADKSRARKKRVAGNGQVVKSRLALKRLNCDCCSPRKVLRSYCNKHAYAPAQDHSDDACGGRRDRSAYSGDGDDVPAQTTVRSPRMISAVGF